MADRSYLNVLDDLDNEYAPYDSISSRPPLDPVGMGSAMGGMAASTPAGTVNPSIAAAILKRKADQKLSNPLVEDSDPTIERAGDMSGDPFMRDYEESQKKLDAYRQAKMGSDAITNAGQAAMIMAQGTNAKEAGALANQLFTNMNRQGEGLLKSNDDDLDRRQKVLQAIEARKAREAGINATAAWRENAAQDRALQREQINQGRNDRLDAANIRTANNLLHDPNINKETTKLNAARSFQTLMDGIKSGEITDSKNIRNQLTNMISMIELGGGGSLADRQGMGIDNLYTRAKDFESFLSSNPKSTIPPKYLTQLASEANALGDRAAQNYKALTDAKLAGADLSGGDAGADPGRVHRLVSQTRDKFLSGNGYDPTTGRRIEKKGMSVRDENTFPKTVRKGNQVADVANQKELEHANQEGWY